MYNSLFRALVITYMTEDRLFLNHLNTYKHTVNSHLLLILSVSRVSHSHLVYLYHTFTVQQFPLTYNIVLYTGYALPILQI
jgi:hypothetical protein